MDSKKEKHRFQYLENNKTFTENQKIQPIRANIKKEETKKCKRDDVKARKKNERTKKRKGQHEYSRSGFLGFLRFVFYQGQGFGPPG